MQIKETHLIAIMVLIVFFAALGVVKHLEGTTDAILRTSQVEGCQRQVARVALISAGWAEIVRTREERNESPETIRRAKAIQQALVETVTPPVGMERGDARMFETVTIIYPSGKQKVELTQDAMTFLRAGCERAYPVP